VFLMEIDRKRSRPDDVGFGLAIASSAVIVLTLLLSAIGALLGAPPQQEWVNLMIGAGIALAMVCAFAGVVIASFTARRRRH
jgi:hypothetical protein